MTTRLTLFDSPLLLGFDHFEETLERLRKSSGGGYPPYNIEQIGEYGLRITLAVAGFSMDDLDVQIDKNQLTVRGKQQDEEERVYLHRGIAARQFQREFYLAEGIEVKTAHLDNGLLHIDLEKIPPDSNAVKIQIQAKSKNTDTSKAIDVETAEEKE